MKEILKKTGKTLGAIVLASAMGLGLVGCNQYSGIDNYSCKKSHEGEITATNGETYAVRFEDNTLFGGGRYINYTVSKDLTFEEAKEILDKCELSFLKNK